MDCDTRPPVRGTGWQSYDQHFTDGDIGRYWIVCIDGGWHNVLPDGRLRFPFSDIKTSEQAIGDRECFARPKKVPEAAEA